MDLKGSLNAIFLKARSAVSQDNQRYINDGWNLDLTYVTPRVIAMGVPGESVAAAYRNPSTEVAAFMQQNHANHFLIFNLSCIRYDYTKFDGRVVEYFFMDHHPPPLDLLLSVVQAMRAFLAAHPENVVVVHCKAGRGRTGVAISSYLFREGICKEPHESVELFSLIRTSTPGCVEFPSQRRYVDYYAHVIRGDLMYYIKPIILDRIVCKHVPEALFVGMNSWRQLPCIEVRSLATNTVLFSTTNDSSCPIVEGDSLIFPFQKTIEGDLLVRFFARAGSLLSSLLETETFRICFNTFFMPKGAYALTKKEIDFQPKDDRFLEDFSVQFDFSSASIPSPGPPGRAATAPLDAVSLAPAPAPLNISQSPSASDSSPHHLPPSSPTLPVCNSAMPCPPPPHRAPPPPPSPTPSPSLSPSHVIPAQFASLDEFPRSPPLSVPAPPPAAVPMFGSLDIYQSYRHQQSPYVQQSPQPSSPSPLHIVQSGHPLHQYTYTPILQSPHGLPSHSLIGQSPQHSSMPTSSPHSPLHASIMQSGQQSSRLSGTSLVQSPQVVPPALHANVAQSEQALLLPNMARESSIVTLDDEIEAYLEEEKNENMRIVG